MSETAPTHTAYILQTLAFCAPIPPHYRKLTATRARSAGSKTAGAAHNATSSTLGLAQAL
eukprot:4597349-Pleurochrysis_carterae.AAC.1